VIVLGAPRSGTKVLARVLKAHPGLAYLTEPRLVWRYGNDRKSDMLRPEDARPEVRAYIRRTFAHMVRERGGSRMLEKTPSNSVRPEFVHTVFPDALMIHIMRDPIDTIAAIRRCWIDPPLAIQDQKGRRRLWSHVREADWRQFAHYAKELAQEVAPTAWRPLVGRRPWGPRIPGLESMVRELDLLDVCALQWRMCVEETVRYGRGLGADRYFEFHLEDWDEGLVQRLASFCHLPDEAAVIEAYRREFVPESVAHRGDDLDPAERDRVLGWIEPTLAWLRSSS
jgi:hypothetical protein